ncbi:hypothetical protein [Amycolatopsis sp. NPDC059657]|uniref:hypothetical protein n=1 Tax=Amycolatopsis sp. NPDC059657 TaxID=3346899 RepID=UPI00366E9FC6
MTTLNIRIDGDDDLDTETRRLRKALLELDVEAVRLPAADAPDGAKGAGTDIGSMVVSLGGSAVLTALVTGVSQVVRTWVTRYEKRSVVIEIGEHKLTLTGGKPEEHDAKVKAFLKSVERKNG